MIQTIITVAIVVAAFAMILRRIRKAFQTNTSGKCDTCSEKCSRYLIAKKGQAQTAPSKSNKSG